MSECVICGARHFGTGKTCSRKCRGRFVAKQKGQRSKFRVCEVCGAGYRATYSKQRSCGRECGRQLPESKAAIARVSQRNAARRGTTSRPANGWPRCKVSFATCARCGNWFTVSRNGAGYKYCGRGCAAEHRLLAGRNYQKQRGQAKNRQPLLAKECRNCGSSFIGTSGRVFCGVKCSRRFYRGGYAGKDIHRERARVLGVEYESGITLGKIMQRDGRLCAICGDGIVESWPNLMAGSIDHIIPMARGGGHTWGNVQAAHFLCNSYKGASEDIDFRLEAANGTSSAASGSQAA